MISENTQAKPLDKTAVKCRFFAQYFGVKVFQNELNKKYNYVNYSYPLSIEKDFNKEIDEFLELKPLSKITDEDALEVANIISNTIHDSISKELVSYYKQDILNDSEVLCYASYQTVDFMRSKGYAISFMGYSVDDLISFGWVRLI